MMNTTPVTLAQLRLGRGERGAIVGQTGTGKSVLSKELIPPYGRVCIIDPKRMFDYPGIPVYEDPKRVWRDKPDRFMFRPKATALTDLSQYDRIYEYCYTRGDYLVYTDDVVGIMDRSRYPHYLQVCYQMGRQKGVAMLSAFQRPCWLPLFLMSESCKFYIFRLTMQTDVSRVNEFLPGYDPSSLRDKHTFMFYDIYTSDQGQQARISLRKHI